MKFFKYSLTIFTIFFILLYGWYSFQMNRVYPAPSSELFIEKGLGVKEISLDLKSVGYIHNDFIFRTYVWWHNLENKFYAGHYILPDKISMKILAEILTGNNSYQPSRRITIIEGWSVEDIADYLNTTAGFDKDEFYDYVGYPINHAKNKEGFISSYDFTNRFSFLKDKPANVGLEGYLFPDTYDLALDSDVLSLVEKMLSNFDFKFTPEMRKEATSQQKTIYEVVVVASILEKELKTYDEKKIGAGLIYSRLDMGMPLQMDSTINFISGKNNSQASLVDLQINSLYNTYQNKGLPPGPISNPGLDSLRAALWPQDSDYLYFLTDKNGIAHFSKTYEEHLANKRKYLD